MVLPMWESNVEEIDRSRLRFKISREGSILSYSDVISHWKFDRNFRAWFRKLPADVPYTAYFWETIAVTKATAKNQFEFVITEGKSLDSLEIDRNTFLGHFASAPADSTITKFPNLGSDALLIAPIPHGDESAYKHLAAFVREAPAQQAESIWQVLGETLSSRLGTETLWVSTSGLGVGWLHIRIDSSPKYYQYAPYAMDI